MGIFFFILGLVLFICLVLVHEWGHFIMARRNGVDVEEFGLGFPPRAKTLTKNNGTEYTLNWLPLGGFVKLKGEHDIDTEPGTFGAATTKAKIKIMLAGVVMNLVAAFVLFTVVAWIGMPKILDNQTTVSSDTKIIKTPEGLDVVNIGQVLADSPAQRADLKVDDRILSIDGEVVDDVSKVSAVTSKNAGNTINITVLRDGQELAKDVELNESAPYLGVGSYSGQSGLEIRRSTWSAPIVAVGVMRDFTIATMKGLGSALSGLGSIIAGFVTGNTQARQAGQSEASSQVSGPVGIFAVLYEISKQGIGLVLFVIAIISLTLAIMNALPIPALDGGRLFVTLLFRAIKKPLTPSLEEKIHGTGFMVLMALFVLITVVDVRRFL